MACDIKGFLRLKSMKSVFIGLPEDDPKYNEVKDKVKKALFLPIFDICIDNSGFMCIAPQGECLVDVRDTNDVESYFLCELEGDVVMPPGLSFLDKNLFYTKRMSRKGGYNHIVRYLVIMNSLRSGKVDDRFLFAYESEATNEI